MSDPVDGNALAGDLRACMHAEMTTATAALRIPQTYLELERTL